MVNTLLSDIFNSSAAILRHPIGLATFFWLADRRTVVQKNSRDCLSNFPKFLNSEFLLLFGQLPSKTSDPGLP